MIDERIWTIMQRRLRYSDEEQARFRADARNERVLARASELGKIQFVIEIVEAHGCNSRHAKGDRIYIDGYGNLIKDKNPDKICIFLIGQAQGLVFAAQEMLYAGIDPNEMKFRRTGCIDVGLGCGGWGKVIMEFSAVKA